MNFKTIFLSLILILNYSEYAIAQLGVGGLGGGNAAKVYDGKISGRVIDASTNLPVEFATIALINKENNRATDGAVTDEQGEFKIKNLKNGNYKLNITFIGYITFEIDSIDISEKKTNYNLGKIVLQPDQKLLKEAVVEGEVSLIENKIDKIVFNASKDITTKGGNAGDVLKKVPMVSVDLEGNVMLRGTTNIRVLINNKPSSIMASSVADAMKMIPADEIDKVEVITNPSAKYDAEGTGGIINIITKKKNMEGLSGSFNLGLGTRSSNLFSNLNYRKGRVGVGGGIGGFGYFGLGNSVALRQNETPAGDFYLKQTGDNQNTGAGPFAQLNFDIDLSSRNSIAINSRLNNFFNWSNTQVGNFASANNESFAFLFDRDTRNKTRSIGLDVSVDYKRSFKNPDKEFSISGQVTNNNRNVGYDAQQFNNANTLTLDETSLNKAVNREYTLQADYVLPINKKIEFETGAKGIRRNVNSEFDFELFDFVTQQYNYDSIRSNKFDYDQDVLAAYAQSSFKIKTKYGIKAGVRYERTIINGDFSRKDNVLFTQDYDNIIPSITVSYTGKKKNTFKLSYTQRIQRPSMQFLNPYVNDADPKNISYGNPALDPELSHSFETGYNFFKGFSSINTSLYHRRTNNAIENIRFVNSNNALVSTYANIGKNTSTGATIGGNYMYQMKLMIGGNFNVFYYTVKSTNDTIDLTNDGINYSINFFGSYTFKNGWGIQSYCNFNGPRYTVQGKATSFFYYSLGSRKEFKNKKGGWGIGLDNFATPFINFKSEYNDPRFTSTSNNRILFLGIRFSVDYRFGKMEFKNNDKKKKIKNDDLKQGEGDGMR
ncbi:MAG: TonB-dependent receptor [Bacteroidetes bacterium]|nr:TonB-dependent receptor [Bacteroidota bacterium]